MARAGCGWLPRWAPEVWLWSSSSRFPLANVPSWWPSRATWMNSFRRSTGTQPWVTWRISRMSWSFEVKFGTCLVPGSVAAWYWSVRSTIVRSLFQISALIVCRPDLTFVLGKIHWIYLKLIRHISLFNPLTIALAFPNHCKSPSSSSSSSSSSSGNIEKTFGGPQVKQR